MRTLAASVLDTDLLRLLGSRCGTCQVVTFPQQSLCPSCSAEDMETLPLSPRGKLWSWTSQNYLPKSPPYATGETRETFRPYAVGLVELPEQLRVEARLVGREPEDYEIGMEMELVLVRLNDDVATYAFQPVARQ